MARMRAAVAAAATLAVFGAAAAATRAAAAPARELVHEETLDASGNVRIRWALDFDADKIEIEATYAGAAGGWVGLGFSPNGGMPGSDIVVAWLDASGAPQFTDRHAPAFGLPLVDDAQHHTLLELVERDGALVLRFERELNTCDEQDMVLAGTSRLIYAYGTARPAAGGDIAKHDDDKRGTRSVDLLLGPQPPKQLPDANVQTFDMAFDAVTVPGGERTRYWWKAMRVPFTKKTHVLKYEPVIPAAETATSHHILVFVCPHELNADDLAYIGDGYHQGTPGALRRCNGVSPIAGWAVGGKAVYMPEGVGFPLGEADSMYLLMELHVDNPGLQTLTVRSGMRFSYTDALRPVDGGIITFGTATPGPLFVPPGVAMTYSGYCPSECTRNEVPAGGVTMHATFQHMHKIGVAIRTRHIGADGTEKAPLADNQNYDFNLQSWIAMDDRTFMPGDEVIVECTYNASKRTDITRGGLSTDDEMCLTYVAYYPRMSLFTCQSDGTAELGTEPYVQGAFAGTKFVEGEDDEASFLAKVTDWSNFTTGYDAAVRTGKRLFQPVCRRTSGGGVAAPPIQAVNPTTAYCEQVCGEQVCLPRIEGLPPPPPVPARGLGTGALAGIIVGVLVVVVLLVGGAVALAMFMRGRSAMTSA